MNAEIEPLFGCYLESTRPGGTASKAAKKRQYWRLRAKAGCLCPNGRRSMAVGDGEAEHYRARIAAAKSVASPTVTPPPNRALVATAIEAVRMGRSPAAEAARERAAAQGYTQPGARFEYVRYSDEYREFINRPRKRA
jgi:hypothetical protein